MSKVKLLLQQYTKYISIPWRADSAASQRVIFCVYNEKDERTLRAKIDEFELTTIQSGHNWSLFDITNTFPTWLMTQKYAAKYFSKPDLLHTLMHRYLEFILYSFNEMISQSSDDQSCVVALKGVGSLFGFLKVKEVVDKIAPRVKGRLLVFFPGSYENNNYRLLDGYDGWDYLAVPITADKDY